MLKILILTIVVLMVFSTPVFAEDVGIHGELSFKYELASVSPGQLFSIDLHYRFADWIYLGVAENTFTNGYKTYFNSIPSFTPLAQTYEFYVTIEFNENLSLKLSQWCNHPVMSDGTYNDYNLGGIYAEGKIKF